MPNTLQQVCFARQPVFDVALDIVAWELLYRAAAGDQSMQGDPAEATARLLVHLFTDFDLKTLLEGRPAFLNFPPQLLEDPPDFDPKRFVIEVDASAPDAGQYLEPINRLWARGYQFSMDNYRSDSPLAEIATRMPYIRLNARSLSRRELKKTLERLRGYHGKIIAERIETLEELRFCQSLGIPLFQGYFLCRPQVESSSHVPESKLVVMRLLDEVRNPECSVDDLQRILSQDPKLSFRLLRLVNSAQYRRAADIRSIPHALAVLGLDQLRSWVTMIALCNLSDKPPALQMSALVRAKMCEQVAVLIRMEDPELMFTAGLFSLLDAFLDRPLPELLDMIHLSGVLREALERGTNREGRVLRFVIAYEQARWDDDHWSVIRETGVETTALSGAYTEATRWAIETLRELRSG